MDILRERISSFLDETILLPTEEFVTEIVKAYPKPPAQPTDMLKFPSAR